ncbi:MAG: DUF6228 family protein [Gemmatimonadota bacterium]|nr:DUF6228 family protein [Gemmatimonadota bacterium]
MTDAFTIKSATDNESLILRWEDPDQFQAEIRCPHLGATTRVLTRVGRSGDQSDGLAEFFGGLAADWKGWTGSREWESLERDLILSAKHGPGGIALKVHLHDGAPPVWKLECELRLESAQLDQLATAAAAFERSRRRAI